jgi:hypothetical protein
MDNSEETSSDSLIGTFHRDSLIDVFIQYILRLSIYSGCVKT